jgi:hypothetical protein
MKLIDILNEIKVKPSQPNLLKLIEDNLGFIKKELQIIKIKSIKLLTNNPQEVQMEVLIPDVDGGGHKYPQTIIIAFRFLEDAENDENFIGDFSGKYVNLTLDGIRIAAIELEEDSDYFLN